jgi:hypothetical protein
MATMRIITPGKNISFPVDKSSKNFFTKVPIATRQQQLMTVHTTTFFIEIALEILFFIDKCPLLFKQTI